MGNFYFITPAKPFVIREEIFFPVFVAAPLIQEKSHPYFSPDRELHSHIEDENFSIPPMLKGPRPLYLQLLGDNWKLRSFDTYLAKSGPVFMCEALRLDHLI